MTDIASVLLPVIAENLVRLRRACDDLSQPALAARAGVSVDVVRRLEQRRGGASLVTLEHLARAMGAHPLDLFRKVKK